ncbi:MAG: hypothetical protein LBT73_02395 [Tannerellaceae bacterium]|jgi:hypothetical protein|nr:hypothetical protein [Tannerellaceae bacterium]
MGSYVDNPFRVPEGYFEGLTDQVMDSLPERQQTIVPAVSMRQRVVPWLYLAAVFTGLLVFFRTLTPTPSNSYSEDADYEVYLQEENTRHLLAEELSFLE